LEGYDVSVPDWLHAGALGASFPGVAGSLFAAF
jgi:hypothetical protein